MTSRPARGPPLTERTIIVLYADKTVETTCTYIRNLIDGTALHWRDWVDAAAVGVIEPADMQTTLDDLCDQLNTVMGPYGIGALPIPHDEDEPGDETHLLAMRCTVTDQVHLVGPWLHGPGQYPDSMMATLRECVVETFLELVNIQVAHGSIAA